MKEQIIHKKCGKQIEDCSCKDARVIILNKSAQALGKIKSIRKKKTSAENGRKAEDIRARLSIYGLPELNEKEFAIFKDWLKKTTQELIKEKDHKIYSKRYRATLYKQTLK